MELFWTALIVALIAGIAQWDVFGWGDTMIQRPLVVGMLMGLALGDLKTGLMVGGTIEFMYLGVVAIGAAVPPDATMATSIAASLSILSGIGAEAGAALAVPVAIASQSLQMLIWTGNIGLLHRADKYAEQANIAGIERLQYTGSFLFFLQGFIPAFLAILLGVNAVKAAVEAVPQWVMDSFTLAGGILPALGFAMLFTMMSSKKLLPYFIIGFALAAYLEMELLGVAIIGVGLMLLHVNRMNEKAATN
ncbi:PTS sugar transporter subunit IIC [Lederbergia sp. NSJ-179]|uniref:PTS mannose/fructose/sorbose/N-acetylgalactosamine transporter subunit IIC n=1 Tax=Lederbergia sp. NSJ-179 TaxID=2931402 RepID=UPI001FD50139|nr:PTS sugar transporter subunit IIC [Lederbergia sp. NSJ-179]MCJ7843109.1 PTS sugar transporter subunit IIC [Lederbergia sp. NSJ-179]